MKCNLSIIILLCSILLTTSCSIEKRLYNRGFHVTWKTPIKGKTSTEHSKENDSQLRLTHELEEKEISPQQELRVASVDSTTESHQPSHLKKNEQEQIVLEKEQPDVHSATEKQVMKKTKEERRVSNEKNQPRNKNFTANLIFGLFTVILILAGCVFLVAAYESGILAALFLGVIAFFCLLAGAIFLLFFLISWTSGFEDEDDKDLDDTKRRNKSLEELEQEEKQQNKKSAFFFTFLLLFLLGIIFIPKLI